MYTNYKYANDRLIGGFAAPFLLGALTGGVATGVFNPYRPRPFYGPIPAYGPRPPFGPRPPYGPY